MHNKMALDDTCESKHHLVATADLLLEDQP